MSEDSMVSSSDPSWVYLLSSLAASWSTEIPTALFGLG